MKRYSFILFILFSCHFIPEEKVSTTDELIDKIHKVQYSDIEKLREYSEALQSAAKDPKTKAIANYFLVKCDVYESGLNRHTPDLLNVYEDLKSLDLTEYLAEIDMLLMSNYFLRLDYEKCKERLMAAYDYMTAPELKLQRLSIVYGFTAPYHSSEIEEKKLEIENVVKEFEDEPWSIYKALIHKAYAIILVRSGKMDEGRQFFLQTVEKSLKANNLIEAADVYNYLTINENEPENLDNRIQYNLNSIDLLKRAKVNNYLELYYKTLGHSYGMNNENKKAFEAYEKSVEYSELLQDTFQMAYNYMYAGFSQFKLDEKHNYDLANKYFTKAENLTTNDSELCRMVVERRMWTLGAAGRKEEEMAVQDQLNDILSDMADVSSESFNNHIKLFKVNHLVESRLKSARIKESELKNQLNSAKIRRQQILILLFFAISILTILYFLRTNKLLSIIKEREEKLSDANKQLNETNHIVESQNEQLTDLLDKLKQSNVRLTSFAHVAAHDIKHPLASMQSVASLLYTDLYYHVSENHQSMLMYLKHSSNHLSEIVNGLLNFSKNDEELTKKYDEVDLNQIIDQVLELLKNVVQDKNAKISVTPNIPHVIGDSKLLTHLFLNMFSNALKFSKKSEDPIINIFYEEKDSNEVSISIQDNGIGIPEEYHETIFDIYSRGAHDTDYEGSGIGLATCKKIIKEHNGDIEVISSTGNGSTFIMTLPTFVSMENAYGSEELEGK